MISKSIVSTFQKKSLEEGRNLKIFDMSNNIWFDRFAFKRNIFTFGFTFRMTAGKIQTELSLDGKKMWASRSTKDHVILMDWNSDRTNVHQPLHILKDILLLVICNIYSTFRYRLFINIIIISFDSGIKMCSMQIRFCYSTMVTNLSRTLTRCSCRIRITSHIDCKSHSTMVSKESNIPS